MSEETGRPDKGPITSLKVGDREITYGIDPSITASAAHARALVEAKYQMALKKPRNREQARQDILKACDDPAFAEKAIYRKPTGGGKFAEGPSIRLAETCLQAWCNIFSESTVILDTPTSTRVRVSVMDLESNVTFSRDLNIQKTVERKFLGERVMISSRKNSSGDNTYLVEATEDEMMNKESSMISKLIRNEGIRCVPQPIISEALDACKVAKEKKINQNPAAFKQRVLDSFASLGIGANAVERLLGHSLDEASIAEMMGLQETQETIRAGEATFQDYLDQSTEGQTQARKDALKKKLEKERGELDAEKKKPQKRGQKKKGTKRAPNSSGKKPGASTSTPQGDQQQGPAAKGKNQADRGPQRGQAEAQAPPPPTDTPGGGEPTQGQPGAPDDAWAHLPDEKLIHAVEQASIGHGGAALGRISRLVAEGDFYGLRELGRAMTKAKQAGKKWSPADSEKGNQ